MFVYVPFETTFSSSLKHVKLQNFLSVRSKHSGLSDDAKMSKFLAYDFSRLQRLKVNSNAVFLVSLLLHFFNILQ